MFGVDQVVAERQGAGLARDPVAADQERLGDAVGARLFGVGEAHAEPRAVAEQAAELRQVLRRGDHQHVADAGQHQGGQRVIDHRLVVDRQQLLGRRQRHRMQSRAGAAGQQNAFHAAVPSRCPGIARSAHRLPPVAMRQVPVDGARQPGLEIVRRRPGQRRLGARRIDLVAEIVARTVGDEMDQPLARAGRIRQTAVQMGADRAHHIQVAARLAGADRVGGARLAVLQHAHQRGGVILDEHPVAPVGAVAVDRQGLALQRVQRDQRDQLLRKLPRAVIVGGVADDRRQPVGVEPSAHQMVGGRLAGRIGAARIVRRGLVERRIVRPERAEHLVGGDVMEAERRAPCRAQRRAVAAAPPPAG